MASISTDKNGNRRILFTNANGERKAIHLGNLPMKLAKEIKTKVEALNSAIAQAHSIDMETSTWLGKIGDELHSKLAAVGLIAGRVAVEFADLKTYFTAYINGRPDLASNSKRNMLQAVRYLFEFFGADRDIRSVTPSDAERFASQMRADFAEATANRTIKFAKQFFKVALREGLTNQNPCRDLKAGNMSNPSRLYYVTREQTERLLEACPGGEWRLIVALARYGGLRTPSEHLVLTWADMDWERNRFIVRSTKTGARWVPMFPELRPHLDEAFFDRAKDGAVHVINRTRSAESNWRTTFAKIVTRAGLTMWEKPFQNLRASRETELAQTHPLHVVTAWIGNSVSVAAKHYLQVTDADFVRAVGSDAQSDAPTAQNTTQTGSGGKCPNVPEEPQVLEDSELRHLGTSARKSLQSKVIHPTGVEPVTFGSVDRCSIQLSYGCVDL